MKRWARQAAIVLLVCLVLLCGRDGAASRWAWAQPPALTQQSYEILEVYLQPEEALALCFPEADRFEPEEIRLTPEQAERVEKLAGHPLQEEAFAVYRTLKDGTLLGYGIVTDEIGRFHNITFLVGATSQGEVRRVEVLVYRESRGGEVRYRRFLHQYDGKSLRHPIRLNRDILNITGATLSVRAINRGVRKVLGVLREAYGVGA